VCGNRTLICVCVCVCVCVCAYVCAHTFPYTCAGLAWLFDSARPGISVSVALPGRSKLGGASRLESMTFKRTTPSLAPFTIAPGNGGR